MTKTFAAVLAISLMILSLMSCTTSQGTTLSVSLTGQPNGAETTVGATNTLGPNVYYRGTAPALNIYYNVLSAPTGGFVNIDPRAQTVTVSGSGATIASSTFVFTEPGTYTIQVVVQETGTGDLQAEDQATFVVLPATNG